MPTGLFGKLVLILTALTVSAVVISSGHSRYQQRLFVLGRAQERAVDDLRLISGNIQSVLTWVRRDLLVLRDLPQLRYLLEAKNAATREAALRDVERAFLSLADHHRIFHQVRFLDEAGHEVVRINLAHGRAQVVSAEELQDKSDRYYFQDVIDLEPDQVYVSQLDLNIEQGEIERPYVPTIRYATPVIDRQGKKRGVIVLNVLGAAILNQLDARQQASQHGERFYLLNKNGFYLYHPDPARTFGFMLDMDARNTFELDEPGVAGRVAGNADGIILHPGALSGKETLFAFQRIQVAPVVLPADSGDELRSFQVNTISSVGDDHWVLLTAVDDAELLVGFREYVRSFLPFTLLLVVACVIVALLVAWSCSRPVISLAHAARRIQDGDLAARAVVYTRDEMGRFGRLFNEMAAKLESSITLLRESEVKYRRLFENSRDCIFVTAPDCSIIDINRAGLELLGVVEGEVPGHLSLSCCESGEGTGKAGPLLELALNENGYVQDFETFLKRPDGSLRICLLTATVRRDETGRLIGYEGILRDITARRQQEEAEREFQQRLQEEIVLAEERERRHIGQVLHEEMAQNLAMVNMQVQKAEQCVCRYRQVEGAVNEEARVCVGQELGAIRELVKRMIQQIRSMVFDLYPAILDAQGLVAAMHWYGDHFSRRTGIRVTIGDGRVSSPLSPSRQIYLFRAFKELLHNAFKHAATKEIVVTVMERERRLRLIVDDEGRGFDPPTAEFGRSREIRGIGLLSIRQWVTVMGGVMTIESQLGKGTRVVLDIPLADNS